MHDVVVSRISFCFGTVSSCQRASRAKQHCFLQQLKKSLLYPELTTCYSSKVSRIRKPELPYSILKVLRCTYFITLDPALEYKIEIVLTNVIKNIFANSSSSLYYLYRQGLQFQLCTYYFDFHILYRNFIPSVICKFSSQQEIRICISTIFIYENVCTIV